MPDNTDNAKVIVGCLKRLEVDIQSLESTETHDEQGSFFQH